MKNWIKFLIVLIICLVTVSVVYIWRFGVPSFLNREEKYINSLYSNMVVEDENIKFEVNNKSIVFTKQNEGKDPEIIEFNLENNVISAVIFNSSTSQEFIDSAIKTIFVAATKINGQSEENAIYSLITDVVIDKTLQEDGYSLINQNGITRFSMKTNEKFNLANGEEVYIKESDIKNVVDVIKYNLQGKIIEKPGIVFEKAVSYSKKLVYIIYEKGRLTNRTYNSFESLITVLLKDKEKAEYVKANYPTITRAGTLTLDGITISLNEKINDNNVHTYNMPENYEYMIIQIDQSEIER